MIDEAQILSPATEAALTEELADLEGTTGRQMVIATLHSLQGAPIEEYGYQLGRVWGVGSADRDDGLLLIVATKERKVRIEVGYGLEGVMTDALASSVIQTSILPRFRKHDLEGGIVAGARAIVDQLRLPDEEANKAATVATVRPDPRPLAWWTGPLLEVSIALIITVFIPALWSFCRGLFGGWRYRPGVIRRRSRGMVDWSAGGSGGGQTAGGGGFSGGGGSFGGGGASGSW
ncbi:MAG: TPM domain-containing protein [Pseudomonadota bacterium]